MTQLHFHQDLNPVKKLFLRNNGRTNMEILLSVKWLWWRYTEVSIVAISHNSSVYVAACFGSRIKSHKVNKVHNIRYCLCNNFCLLCYQPLYTWIETCCSKTIQHVNDCCDWLPLSIKFTVGQAAKAQRGSRGKLYSFFNLSARWGVGWSVPHPSGITPGKDLVCVV